MLTVGNQNYFAKTTMQQRKNQDVSFKQNPVSAVMSDEAIIGKYKDGYIKTLLEKFMNIYSDRCFPWTPEEQLAVRLDFIKGRAKESLTAEHRAIAFVKALEVVDVGTNNFKRDMESVREALKDESSLNSRSVFKDEVNILFEKLGIEKL